jgi:hypothetical protein
MHMAQVIGAGILLLGVFLLFGKLWGTDNSTIAVGATLFLPTWLALAVANMWVGVTKAGYTLAQELPILLVVFAVPAAVALAVAWRLSRT